MRKRRETLEERIDRERRQMHLSPWQFAPSEVDDGPNPYTPGVAGYRSWIEAQAWRDAIRKREPSYFDDLLDEDE
jgi:hypothetical protein